MVGMEESTRVQQFWQRLRVGNDDLPQSMPEAWAFGAEPEQADELLGLVLEGIKTATAASFWDHQWTGDPIPEPGQLNIVLDGSGDPRALIETTDVQIIPFNEVGVDHARAEGEGDRSLEYWRRVHQEFWAEHSQNPRKFQPDMPVVCERFRLLWPTGTHQNPSASND